MLFLTPVVRVKLETWGIFV